MIPYIITPWGNIPTFIIMICIGIMSFLGTLHMELNKNSDTEEEIVILPKIIYSMLIGYFFAALFDSIFKFYENKKIVFSGITFYGGLIGGMFSLYVMLFFNREHTKYSIKEWLDKLTIPFIIFHMWGRLGCFCAGCCYGKETNSFIGVKFPDNNLNNIFHHGNKCFPTQLFEVFALAIIVLCVSRTKNKCKTYLVLYSISRFIIEFFRGDSRGTFIAFLSPAQIISIVIMILVMVKKIFNKRYL